MRSWNPFSTLKNAARNSPWIVMAVALHLILIAIATVFYTTREKNVFEVKPIEVTQRPKVVEEFIPPPEIYTRDAIPESKSTELVDLDPFVRTDARESAVDIPLGDPNVTNDLPPSLAASSTAIGAGTGPGRRGFGPTPFDGRDRFPSGPGSEIGGGPLKDPLDRAVLAGLRWLARHQNEDGSWGANSLNTHCDPERPCDASKGSRIGTYDEGLTSLALLAYLGAGFSHQSQAYFKDPERGQKKVKTGDVVAAGLKWLVAQQGADGSFGKDRPFMYNQALATMALAEAYGLTRNRYWREPAQRAVDYLQGAQRPNPSGQGLWGWRYASRQEIERFHQGDSLDEKFRRELYDADTSVTAWAVMALKSAQMAGLDVQQANLDGALAFARWVSVGDGQAGYIDPKGAGAKVTGPDDQFDYHAAGMSALSMCVRAFAAHDLDDPFLEPASKRLVSDLPRISPDKLSVDYYYWYYGSLALFQFDGPDSPRARGQHWGAWNKAMQKVVPALQEQGKGCAEGGWLVPDRWCHSGGPIYATAINVLTLEVYYRYDNAFSVGRKRHVEAPPPIQGAK
ncbi:MAG: terpene cyclase/mutase family protein [Planctomycetes bacterium]|nr:terpene cyclase/mutase family protein [Planctomycetota bacterium]